MGLENAANNRVGTFSRGMAQRLGLASCLVGEPKILFLDDPLLGLDPIGQKELMQLILELKNQGKTVFFCSHILSQAEKICDRVGIILEGGLKFAGNLADFLSKHNTSSLEEAFFREIGQ